MKTKATASKLLKWTIAFLLAEGILIALYIYNQPNCEPCLPGDFCPPCVSDRQVFIRWAGLALAALYLAYSVYLLLTRRHRRLITSDL